MGGKSTASSKDYYGHCAGVVCQGQLDFFWGLLVNNNLVYPVATVWDAQTYAVGQCTLYSDGNVYQFEGVPGETNDPPNYPWQLFASAWTAGTYAVGSYVVYLGNVWQVFGAPAVVAPPATAPAVLPQNQPSFHHQTPVNNWIYISTPSVWVSANFWGANSIVAWDGRLYTTAVGTKAEPPNAPWTLWKIDRATSANPLKFTVPNMGDCYLYWGTANQTLDTVNEQILNSLGHPPYRNKAVIVIKNFLFGTMQTSPPDIVLLGGRAPVQTLITGASAALDVDWQANPWCVLAEMLTHPVIGLGLPNSFFNQAQWQAEADRCATNPALYYISPLYSDLKKVRELVRDLMGYPDAFVFWSTLGQLSCGHWPHGDAPPAFTPANTVDRNCLTEELGSNSDLWGATFNGVSVSFQDIQSGFKSRPVLSSNLYNANAIRRMQTQNVDRPHIVRYAQAKAWADEFAKLAGDELLSGQVTIQAEKATGIAPGSLFLLTDDYLATSQIMRCTRRVISSPPAGTVKLAHETERGVSPRPYSPSALNPTQPQGPAPSRIGNFAVVQLPATLGESSTIAVLAGRTNDVTSQLAIWFQQADNAAFQQLGTNNSFAVPGFFDVDENTAETVGGNNNTVSIAPFTVTQGTSYPLGHSNFWKDVVTYSATIGGVYVTATEGVDYVTDPVAGTITISIGGAIANTNYVKVQLWNSLAINYDTTVPNSDLESIMESLTLDEIANGEILLFAFQAANPALVEIMSVTAVTAVGNGTAGTPTLFIGAVRAQFGSLKGGDGSYVWGSNSNDIVFIMRRAGLDVLSHESFAGFQIAQSTMALRLVPNSAWVQGDINDLYDPANNPGGLTTAFNYTWNDIYAPTATWIQLLQNGAAITDFTVTFATTDVFNFSFNIADTNGDLQHGALIAISGQQEVTLWASNFTGQSNVSKTVQFQLATGLWSLELRLLDAAGNASTYPLIYGGNPVTMTVNVNYAPSPIIYSYSTPIGGSYISNLVFGKLPSPGSGFKVYYQLQNIGTAFNPASWILCSQNTGYPNYCYGDPAYGDYVPQFKKSTKTLYAYSTQTGKTDSAVVSWNL